MAKQHHHLHLLLAAVLTTTASILLHAAAAAAETVYDVLDQNRLPRGLLPQGVQSYAVHVGGALDVTLPAGECDFSVAADGKAYRFRYSRRVGGVLVNMSITRAYGTRMALGPAWYDVAEMRRVGDRLRVELPVSVQWFPVIAFAQSPRCT